MRACSGEGIGLTGNLHHTINGMLGELVLSRMVVGNPLGPNPLQALKNHKGDRSDKNPLYISFQQLFLKVIFKK